MEKLVYLDTHAVVWLYAAELTLFPPVALGLVVDVPLLISPAVLLELQYLFEIERIKVGPEKIFKNLEKSLGLKICRKEFQEVVTESLKQSWTRDPFDRLIVAQAVITHAPLITRDESILKHYPKAFWR